jgi:hypothetical protein
MTKLFGELPLLGLPFEIFLLHAFLSSKPLPFNLTPVNKTQK